MIKINGGGVTLEGQLGDLIIEAARIIDSVAKAVERKLKSEGASTLVRNTEEKNTDYDFTVDAILQYLEHMQKIDVRDQSWEENSEIEFLQEAVDLRNKHHSKKDFIDYDSGIAPSLNLKKKGKSEIEESSNRAHLDEISITGGRKLGQVGDFVIDSRIQGNKGEDAFDIDDLKAIKALQVQQKKK